MKVGVWGEGVICISADEGCLDEGVHYIVGYGLGSDETWV